MHFFDNVDISFYPVTDDSEVVASDFLPTTSTFLFVFVLLPLILHLVHHRVQVKSTLQHAKGRQQKRQHRNVSRPLPALLLRPANATWLRQAAGCAGCVRCCLEWSVLPLSQH